MIAASEQEQRDRVCDVALSWIGTPYHQKGRVKGAGADCATLLLEVYAEAGVIDYQPTPEYSDQFFLHSAEELYLARVLGFAREIELERTRAGDLALYKIGKCYAHGAIIVKPGWPAIVHAHYAARRVRLGVGTSMRLGTPILGIKYFTRW